MKASLVAKKLLYLIFTGMASIRSIDAIISGILNNSQIFDKYYSKVFKKNPGRTEAILFYKIF